MEEIEFPIQSSENLGTYLESLPSYWAEAKPDELPELILLTRAKSRSKSSIVTIYVWGLGRIGITVIIQCIEKEGMCSVSIDANATLPTTSTQITEQVIREMLKKHLGLN
ncbi:MAG: hypothetical protein ACXAEF_00615 [Candidatus Thorarchaeota archaeon]